MFVSLPDEKDFQNSLLNKQFTDVLRDYRKRQVAWNGPMALSVPQLYCIGISFVSFFPASSKYMGVNVMLPIFYLEEEI